MIVLVLVAEDTLLTQSSQSPCIRVTFVATQHIVDARKRKKLVKIPRTTPIYLVVAIGTGSTVLAFMGIFMASHTTLGL
jgi:hypothetical protein